MNKVSDKVKLRNRSYYLKNRDRILAAAKAYWHKRKDDENFKSARKAWVNKNAEQISLKAKLYREKNREKLISYCKNWRKENEQRLKEKKHSLKHYHLKYRNDVNYRLLRRARAFVGRIFSGHLKSDFRSMEYIGCTVSEFRKHIESLWKPGMSWENYSLHGWHIDHIKPLCSFDFSVPEHVKQATHYTNLQPLWAKENLMKSGKT